MPDPLSQLLTEIAECRVCSAHLPLGPRPVLRAQSAARIMLIGQAPGTKVHASGIPWHDASGERLRSWLGVDSDTFYDSRKFAIMPMGFCYPGKGRSGDLPPRPECAPLWHARVQALLPNLRLTILIGTYALDRYLGGLQGKTLGETVRSFQNYAPAYIPLVHPSPRNQLWLKKNPWFEIEVVPQLRSRIAKILSD